MDMATIIWISGTKPLGLHFSSAKARVEVTTARIKVANAKDVISM